MELEWLLFNANTSGRTQPTRIRQKEELGVLIFLTTGAQITLASSAMLVHSFRSIFAQITSGPWLDTVRNAPVSVQAITAVLFIFFLVCFFLLIGKARELASDRRADASLLAAFRGSAHPLAMLQNGETFADSPLSPLYHTGARELSYHLLGTDQVDKDFLTRLRAAGKIVPSQMRAIREAIHREVLVASLPLEARIGGIGVLLRSVPWLAALAPLIALIETETSSATVSDAASRLTLLLSLVPVALALFGTVICQMITHLLSISVHRERQELSKFALELGNVFDRQYVDYRQPMDHLPSISSFGPPDSPSFSLPPGDPSPTGRSFTAPAPPA